MGAISIRGRRERAIEPPKLGKLGENRREHD
jgi:hypothetical protein